MPIKKLIYKFELKYKIEEMINKINELEDKINELEQKNKRIDEKVLEVITETVSELADINLIKGGKDV